MEYQVHSMKSSQCTKGSSVRWKAKMMNGLRNHRRNGLKKSKFSSKIRKKKQDISSLKKNFLNKEFKLLKLNLRHSERMGIGWRMKKQLYKISSKQPELRKKILKKNMKPLLKKQKKTKLKLRRSMTT